MYPVILFIAAILVALVRIIIKHPASKREIAGIFLLYMIFFNIGLGGLYAFMGHAFMPAMVAREIGWPIGSPFQFEIAIANLSYGMLGMLSIWIRGKFWIAVVTGNLAFLWGAAYGHIVQMEKRDMSPYNTGIFLYAGDIVIPLVILLLLLYYFRLLKYETPVSAP
jgi:hypothetical protein